MPYKFNPFTGKLDNAPGAPVFKDNKFRVVDEGDPTKRVALEVSGVSPSTTRTLTVQDQNGPIAVGYGAANQYIRGDATISNFPVAAGGGSSVSYYFNGSVSQGTILGNPYYEINKTPAGAAQTNFTINAGNTTAYFITDANDPALLSIPQGNFTFQLYALTSSGNPQLAVELYKYDGAAFTQIGATSPTVTISNTTSDIHLLTVAIPASTTLAITDRLAVRVIGVSLGGHTITLNTEGNTQSQIITTFSTGMAALNGLTDQIQFLATGTTGTDFNINSTAATHTFNIPTASAANRGALSSADWTTFNNKIGAGAYTAQTGLTMNTARLLGRTTGGSGAAEEITVGTGLSLTGGTLTNTAAGVTSVTATAPITSSGGATPDISTSISTNKVVGRHTAGTGVMEELTPVGITVSGGNITGIGGTVGTVDNAVPRADGTGGYTLQSSPASISDVNTSLQTTVAIGPDRTTFSITGDAGTDVITATGHNFVTNQAVSFPTLTGGSGLNFFTRYFVRDVTASTFKVSTTIGGGAVDFTTNITAGTVQSSASLVLLQGSQYALESIQTAIPDGTAVGGNARGTGAVDLSMQRAAAADVASGSNSFVGPGYAGRAAGGWSAAIACYDTQANGQFSFAAQRGAISATSTSTAIGYNARANTNEGPAAVGGWSNTSSGIRSGVFGGEENEANNSYSGTLAGYRALSNRYGMHSHAAGQFSAKGDAQRARFVLRCKTTTNAAVEMALDGSATYLTIPSGKVMFMNIKVVGTKSDGSAVATYERQYAVKNVAGTSSEIYAAVIIGTDNAAGTSLAVATVDAGDYVSIKPTGVTSETWRWVASVDAVEVAYGT